MRSFHGGKGIAAVKTLTSTGMLLLLLQIPATAAEGTGDYIHYRLGVKYKNENKPDRAIDEFRKVLAAYPDNYNAYFQMAEIRRKQGRPRLVIYNLKKALSYNPGWSRAQKMLADAYEKDGQLQKAIVELQQCQQTSDPAERDSIQLQIDRLIGLVSGQKPGENSAGPDQTEKKVESVTAVKEPVATGNKTQAVKPSQKKKPASTGGTSSVDATFDKAVELYNNEKFDKAIQLLREVLAVNPKHAGAYYYAGLIRYRKKQYHMATINLRKGLGWSELGFNGHYYLGKIYGEQKKYAQAITHLFKYIEKTSYEPGKKEAQELIETYRRLGGSAVLDAIAPGTPVAASPADSLSPRERYLTLEVRIDSMLTMLTVDTLSDVGQQLLGGIHLFTFGKYDDAIREFKKVLAKNPSGTVAVHCLYNTGICYLKLRLLKEAENQFQQILDRYGRHPVAAKSLFLKAVTYLERSEPGTGEKLLRSFLQRYRDHRWAENAWEKLGDAYLDLEQPRKAVDAYQQSVAISRKKGDKVAVLFKLGKAYQEIGNGSKAVESYERAIEVGEKADVYLRVPDSYYRIADELYKKKNYKKALEYYTRATRKYPAFQETPWGLFQIGSINRNLKRYQDAIDAFKELTRKFPDDYWARQAQWKLEDTIWEHEYKAVLR
ncbi:MAG: tetratricopeptide repeat protein [Chitinispirillaceae bacterium]|nr:tetratricopeptide repeat protein [Chitinispirillaceae bacterium]